MEENQGKEVEEEIKELSEDNLDEVSGGKNDWCGRDGRGIAPKPEMLYQMAAPQKNNRK